MLTILTKIIKTIVLVLSVIFFLIISLYLLEEEKPPGGFIIEKSLGKGNFGNVTLCRTPPEVPFFEEHPYVAVKQMKFWELSHEFHILKNLDHR